MGAPEAKADPVRGPASVKVVLTRQFYLGTTEVTQAQWRSVMRDNPSQFQDAPDLPVERVSWNDCQEFLARLNRLDLGTFRLPTEAEWEYACRAGTRTRYFWGDSDDPAALDAHAWHGGNAGHRTHPVRRKKPNAWGFYDLCGNVGEWCNDRFGPYPDHPVTDPRGPLVGEGRVIRGGSYFPAKSDCRSAARDHAQPDVRIAFIGLRLVREDR
jgi:formylglycine-generating enzyme required for sulfatase activity